MSTNRAGEPLAKASRRGRVGILTLNRPEVRNAVNAELAAAIADVLDDFAADDDVWVIVITGAGDKAFCAGQDLKELGRRPPDPARGGWAGIVHRQFDKPVIAAVNGFALGGGTEICLACDCVVADEHAQFGLPEVTRGIVAGAGGLERLPRRIPPAVAMELILTGRAITAQRALELGLVNRVVPSGTCLDAAIELAEEICRAAPLAVRYSKRVARASFSMGQDAAVAQAAEERRVVLASEDAQEGARAFAERRAPVWRGR